MQFQLTKLPEMTDNGNISKQIDLSTKQTDLRKFPHHWEAKRTVSVEPFLSLLHLYAFGRASFGRADIKRSEIGKVESLSFSFRFTETDDDC